MQKQVVFLFQRSGYGLKSENSRVLPVIRCIIHLRSTWNYRNRGYFKKEVENNMTRPTESYLN
uniref:Uncharacterized protein n=1 Tax=Helianthus annuus TaxID=4232 RepID=A0A251TJG5_HELAN